VANPEIQNREKCGDGEGAANPPQKFFENYAKKA